MQSDTPEKRRGKLARYSTLNEIPGQKCYRLSSGTELKTKLGAHAMLEEQIKALSLHAHEGSLELSVGGHPKASVWETFYFKLEPSRLVYYNGSTYSTPQQGGEVEGGMEPAGQFLLEEILSVNSRGKLCEIELRDNHDNLHFLRASSKDDLKTWTFTMVKALACIGCQKKLAEINFDPKSSALLRKRPKELKSKSHVGCFATEGRRSSMEDEWFVREKAATRTYPTLFGIFDGHSGVKAAQFARDALPDLIIKKLVEDVDTTTVLKEAFITVERMFLDQALTTMDRSGTTALIVMASATEVVVSNCGDSRAVLCRNRCAIDLSRDHKPFQPDEKARIEGFGGWVEEVEVLKDIPRLYRLGLDLDTLDETEENSVGWVKVYRVNGVLAMSRSIGDLLIKDLKNQHFDMEFTGDLVLAEPEVTTTKLEPETDRFVVAATDGLWDVMTSQEVVEYIYDKILAGKNIQSICAKLCNEAVERGSLDNICIIVIDLHHLYYPPAPKNSLPIRTTTPTPSNRNSRDFCPSTPPASTSSTTSPSPSTPATPSSTPPSSSPSPLASLLPTSTNTPTNATLSLANTGNMR